MTTDADICPARGGDDLQRLARALVELRARVRTPGVPEGNIPLSDRGGTEPDDAIRRPRSVVRSVRHERLRGSGKRAGGLRGLQGHALGADDVQGIMRFRSSFSSSSSPSPGASERTNFPLTGRAGVLNTTS